MKSFTRKYANRILLLAAVMFFSLCSQSYPQQDENKNNGDKTLTFTEKEDGKIINYKVNFKNGEIFSIYRNDEKVPDDQIENYSDIVYDELNSIQTYHKPYVFHFDSEKFRENMNELIGKLNIDSLKLKFDKEKFKVQMQKLKEELKDMDEIVIKIDKDKIKSELDKIKVQKFNFDYDFDFDFKEHKLNMEELEEEMKSLNEEIDDLSKEMEELNKEMKILDHFLSEAKKELRKDGYIKDDEAIRLELSDKEMIINDEKVPSSVHKKYLDIYKKHYDEVPESRIKFHLD